MIDLIRWLNEVVTGAIRDWWRTRNDPPAMLPDKVTWTVTFNGDDPCPQSFMDERNALEGGRTRAERWKIHDVIPAGPELHVRFRREDGAYYWRNDGFRGF